MLNKFLTFRNDSLLVGCVIGAAVAYGPVDVAALGSTLAYTTLFANTNIKNNKIDNPEDRLNQWIAARGLSAKQVSVNKCSSKWTASI